jgi:hypothetical protein
MSEHESPRAEPDEPGEGRRGEHNELGYRNVDEEAEHDEAGTQGPGRGEPPARERSRDD